MSATANPAPNRERSCDSFTNYVREGHPPGDSDVGVQRNGVLFYKRVGAKMSDALRRVVEGKNVAAMETQNQHPARTLFVVRASESIMVHDGSVSNDERDVLLTYVKTLSDRYPGQSYAATRLLKV